MAERPKLVLIDGHALLYRAYHALPATMVTSRGEPTNALYGFLSTVLKVLSEEQPDYVIVCMDRGRTFRHDLYKEYKAHRAKMPDDLRPQVERAEEVLRALGIPSCGLDGYEADDLIGTLARQADEAGLDTLIITGDSDALQLVREHVHVLVPGRKYSDTVRYDPARVRERYGFEAERLSEFKALKGDPSDNIPGVPGIGEKTAEELVRDFGTLEAIYDKLEQVPPRYRKALEENRELAFLSRDLARIRTDVPIRLDLESSRFGTYDREAVVRLFRELEFRSLLERLPGRRAEVEPAQISRQLPLFAESAPAPPETAEQPAYRIVQNEAALKEMLAALGSGPLALDTETTSIQPMDTELVGISLARGDGRAWYIPVGHRTPDGRRLPGQLPWEQVRRHLSPLLGDARIPKIAHHAKFDTLVLSEQGLEVRGIAFDTLIAAYLVGGRSGLAEGEGEAESGSAALRKDRSIGLKNLAFRYLGVEMRDIAEILGKGKAQRTMDQVPIEVVGPYACADADMTFRLKEVLEKQLVENDLRALFEEVEMPLVEVLREMERTGVLLDIPFLLQMSRELQHELEKLEEEIYGYAGHPFNVNSTQQLGEVLFRELGLPLSATSKLKSGAYSTASDVLEKLRHAHPIVEAVLRLRELAKLKSTYVDALPLLVNRRTGRVHTSFNQTATATGRLSSSDPNLQNIPIRTEIGRRVRQAFIASPGWALLSADYSQVELRILAHLSQDPGLLEDFRRGEDVHASTAATLFSIPVSQVTPEQRRMAKTVNFGLMYGMSDYGLAQRLGIDQKEAAQFIATYFRRYAGVRRYLEETIRRGRELGYVSTVLGRRRYIPELRSSNRNVRMAAEREAVNTPIQGTAADIIKIAMVRLHRALQERHLRSRMILQVHDELVLEVPAEEVEAVVPLVKEVMEGAYRLDAPLQVEIHVGPNWGALK
ncbi:MAG: DNA polymerase I [Chloroflexia bacterium]